MLINLTDIFASEGKETRMQVDLEMAAYENRRITYQITDKTPVSLVFYNTGIGRAHMEGSVRLAMMLCCDRCLKDVKYEFDLSFTEDLRSPEAGGDTEEGREFMEDYSINLEDFMSNEILINWPTKVLCSEDCKGICRQCGQDLNEGDCGCDTFIPDPRMAVIKDIFNAGKEV